MHFDWWTFALQTANFVILVWLLHRFLYKPVLRMIDARRAEVEKQYAEASKAKADAEATRAATEAARAGIVKERDAALKVAAAQAQEAAQARHAQAEREAEALVADARKTLATEREQVLAEARRLALDLGEAVARRLLAEVPSALRAEAWLERMEQHLASLPPAELKALITQFTAGGSLKVVTVSALPPASAEIWRNRLGQQLGDGIPITFDIDPAIVAGVELHFPSAVLHFSWRNALAAMRAEVEANGNAR